MSRIEQRIVTRFLSFTNCGKVRHTFQNEPLERSPRNRRDIGNETTRDRKLEVNLMSLASTKNTRKSSPCRLRFLVYSHNANAQISLLIFVGDPIATEKRSSIDRHGVCNLREGYLGSGPGIIDEISRVEQEETHLSGQKRRSGEYPCYTDTLRRRKYAEIARYRERKFLVKRNSINVKSDRRDEDRSFKKIHRFSRNFQDRETTFIYFFRNQEIDVCRFSYLYVKLFAYLA